MESINKTIKIKPVDLFLFPFCLIYTVNLIHEYKISHNFEKYIKHVNTGGLDVKGDYLTPYETRFTENAALFGDKSFISKLGEARYSDTSPGIDVI